MLWEVQNNNPNKLHLKREERKEESSHKFHNQKAIITHKIQQQKTKAQP